MTTNLKQTKVFKVNLEGFPKDLGDEILDIPSLEELNDKKKSLEEEMNKIDQELEVIDKLKDDSLDLSQKKEIIEKEYGALENSYEMKVQSVKRNINWGKEFFKF